MRASIIAALAIGWLAAISGRDGDTVTTGSVSSTDPESLDVHSQLAPEIVETRLKEAEEAIYLNTIEGRNRALHILNQVRIACVRDTRFFMLEGLLYRTAGRLDDSRRSYAMASKLDSLNLKWRVECARSALDRMLEGYDRLDLTQCLDLLEQAIKVPLSRASIPDGSSRTKQCKDYNYDARYLKAVCLCLKRTVTGVEPVSFTEMSEAAYRLTSELIKERPVDLAAIRLHAVNCLDSGKDEEADLTFRRAFSFMPKEAPYFLTPTALREDPEFARGNSDAKRQLRESYWRAHNPDPGDLINRTELESWRKTAIAMLFFGEPWNSEIGRTFMQFGPPVWVSGYNPNTPNKPIKNVDQGREFGFADGTVLRAERPHPAQPFHLEPKSVPKFLEAVRSGPALERMVDTRTVRSEIVATSFPDESNPQKAVLKCLMGLPLWSKRELGASTATFTLENRSGQVLTRNSLRLTEGDLKRIFPKDITEKPLLLISQDFGALVGGRYFMGVEVRIKGGQVVAHRRKPVVVKNFNSELSVSGLEPFVLGSERWDKKVFGDRNYAPTLPLVPTGRGLAFFYNILGLTAATQDARGVKKGEVYYVASHAVIPAEVVDRTAGRLRLDMNSLDNPALQGEVDALFSSKLLNYEDYFPIEYQPQHMNVSKSPQGIVRAAAVLSAGDRAPGTYYLVVQVRDLNSPRSSKVAYSAVPFRVEDPSALARFSANRKEAPE